MKANLVFLLWAGLTQVVIAGPERLLFAVESVDFSFVRVPTGEFYMGTRRNEPTEQPRHMVKFEKPFAMSATEVTVRQFRLFAEATRYVTDAERRGQALAVTPAGWDMVRGASWRNPGLIQMEDDPVVLVSWTDGLALCHWLESKIGGHVRLPSEAEWEYACRSGTRGDYAGAPAEGGWDLGWHLYNARGRPQPVGRKPANGWGLHDMHGNVWEWCDDTWHYNYVDAPADGSAWLGGGALVDGHRVWRGGAWNSGPGAMRSSMRVHAEQYFALPNCGLRLVRLDAKPGADDAPPQSAAFKHRGNPGAKAP